MPFDIPNIPRPRKIVPPPIPPSKLPQVIAPTPLSRWAQIASFTLATGPYRFPYLVRNVLTRLLAAITSYAVLIHDFGDKEHVFMPVRAPLSSNSPSISPGPQHNTDPTSSQVRRWFDDHTASFFTLSARDRAVLDAQKPRLSAHEQLREAVMPSTKTPIEFFKENPVKLSSKEEAEKKV